LVDKQALVFAHGPTHPRHLRRLVGAGAEADQPRQGAHQGGNLGTARLLVRLDLRGK
jgi:hypothetical protein